MMAAYLGYGVIADRPADPGVQPGELAFYWATDTSTLYAWDGSLWNVMGGGGATLPRRGMFHDRRDTASSAAFAFKGMIFQPTIDITVSAVFAFLVSKVNGATYNAVIAPVSSLASAAPTITAVPSATASVTVSGTAAELLKLSFAAPITLTAGTPYVVLFGRSDSTTTYVLTVGLSSTAADAGFPVMPLMPGFQARLASTAPANGNTLDTNSSSTAAFTVGLEWKE